MKVARLFEPIEHYKVGDGGGMETIGSMQEFQPEVESISSYLKRLQVFIRANGIVKETMVPVLLSVIGAKMYGLLRNLVSPAQISDRSYDELGDVLKAHFDPKTVIIAEHFHFHRMMQAPTESITE